jgi:hypothetical protein
MSFNANRFSNRNLRRNFQRGGLTPDLLYYEQLDGFNMGRRNAPQMMSYSDNSFSLASPVSEANMNMNRRSTRQPISGSLRNNNNYAAALNADGATMMPRLPRQRVNENGVMSTDNRFLMASDNKTAVTCTQGLDDRNGKQPIQCAVLSSGEEQQARQFLTMGSTPGVQHPKEIVGMDTQGWRNVGKAPLYSVFDDGIFNTQSPTHLNERKKMTGVLVNTNTGQMFETYEDDTPPPNTNQSMQPEQLKQVNPKLVALQGGIDFNRPPRSKTEIPLNMPGVDAGANVWGDQLYAGRRRQRELEIAAADVWGNRGGNYSVEPIMDGRPTGYVGYQNMVRIAPYATPTQRGRDSSSYQGSIQNLVGLQGDKMIPHTTISKPDLSTCPRTPMPGAANGVDAEWMIPAQVLHETDRGVQDTSINFTGAGTSVPTGHTVADMEELRPYLKEVMSVAFSTHGAAASTAGTYVHMDSDLPDSLKESLMAKSFLSLGIMPDIYVTDNVAAMAQADTEAPQRAEYSAKGPAGATVGGVAPSIRVFQLDVPDTMRSTLEGLGIQGSVFALQDGTGQWRMAYESDLPSTMRSILESASMRAGPTQVQDGWMLPNLQPLGDTLKEVTVQMRPHGQISPGQYQTASRPDGRRDVRDQYRGDREMFAWVTPTQVPNDGQSHASVFDNFTLQHTRKPARQFPGVVMPPAPPAGVPTILRPLTTCKQDEHPTNMQLRAASLTNRPTYFTEASVS